MDLLTTMFLILVGSFALSHIFHRIKIPKVLAPIILGIVFHNYLPEMFVHSEFLEFLASLGAIMLLFYVSLEINFKRLKEEEKETMPIAHWGFLITFFAGFLVSYLLFGYSMVVSFVLASVISVTAEGVAVNLLKENRLLKSKVGDIVVSAGLIDDVIGIVLLLILSLIVAIHDFSLQFFLPTILGVIVIIVLFHFIRKVSEFIDSFLVNKDLSHNPADLLTISLIFLFGFAIFTNYIHLEFSLGAILGGLILNYSLNRKKVGKREEKKLTEMVSFISFGFLSYFFFFWIGFQVSFDNIFGNLGLGLILVGFAMGGKLIGVIIGARSFRESLKNKVLIGLGMSSKGGVELIIAEIARRSGLISIEVFSAIVFMSVVLTIAAPIIFNLCVEQK